mmetsp:Transcript_50957/g.61406  ORF Transcript_50957/g.61406 Transcript_50957/m.61406 type:complete len:97 (+) Transcript_50957:225-515(+)
MMIFSTVTIAIMFSFPTQLLGHLLRGENYQPMNVKEVNEVFLWATELGANNKLTVNKEDGAFWERELGGSHRRQCAIVVKGDEDSLLSRHTPLPCL